MNLEGLELALPPRIGATVGTVKAVLGCEALLTLAGAVVAYEKLSGNWKLFALLFLGPDLSMLGYLINRSVGAVVYNVGHSYLSPGILAFLGLATSSPLLECLALIWIVHIGFDRALGFGLKYASCFGDTHLGQTPGATPFVTVRHPRRIAPRIAGSAFSAQHLNQAETYSTLHLSAVTPLHGQSKMLRIKAGASAKLMFRADVLPADLNGITTAYPAICREQNVGYPPSMPKVVPVMKPADGPNTKRTTVAARAFLRKWRWLQDYVAHGLSPILTGFVVKVPRGYIVAIALAVPPNAFASCVVGRDPPSCWTHISNNDLSNAAKTGTDIFLRAFGGVGGAGPRGGGLTGEPMPSVERPPVNITQRDLDNYWKLLYPEVVQPTGRFINREAIDLTTSAGNAADKVREGKVVDAVWELTTAPVKTTDANAGKLVQESPVLDIAGHVAATAYGGPAGAAAYASWSTYHKTGDTNQAVKAGVLAGISTMVVNHYSPSAAAETSSSLNPVLVRKAIEGGSIIGVFAAVAGENGTDTATAALKGGAAIYFNGSINSVSGKVVANQQTIKMNGGWTISWSTTKLPNKLMPIVVNYTGSDADLNALAAKSQTPESVACTLPGKQDVVAKISVDFPQKPSRVQCVVNYETAKDGTTHPWRALNDRNYCADKAKGLTARLISSGLNCHNL